MTLTVLEHTEFKAMTIIQQRSSQLPYKMTRQATFAHRPFILTRTIKEKWRRHMIINKCFTLWKRVSYFLTFTSRTCSSTRTLLSSSVYISMRLTWLKSARRATRFVFVLITWLMPYLGPTNSVTSVCFSPCCRTKREGQSQYMYFTCHFLFCHIWSGEEQNQRHSQPVWI